jgi:hypothetical protein
MRLVVIVDLELWIPCEKLWTWRADLLRMRLSIRHLPGHSIASVATSPPVAGQTLAAAFAFASSSLEKKSRENV